MACRASALCFLRLFWGVHQGTDTGPGGRQPGPVPCSRAWGSSPSCPLTSGLMSTSDLEVDELSVCRAAPRAQLPVVLGEERLSEADRACLRVCHGLCLSALGASQAANRESIQKAISRLDEDLTTVGQMSKLSDSLGFPHQVRALRRGSPTLSEGQITALSFA